MCLNLCLNLLLILFLLLILLLILFLEYRRLIIKTACGVCVSQAVLLNRTVCDVCLSQAVLSNRTACDLCLSQAVFDWPPVMLFYITGGAPQAVPGTACVEANRTACTKDPCSSVLAQCLSWGGRTCMFVESTMYGDLTSSALQALGSSWLFQVPTTPLGMLRTIN
jgi:hypothetical protein